MGISYRKATKDDITIIKDMLYHAIFIPEGQPQPSKDIVNIKELRKYYEEWGKPGDIGFIAYTPYGATGAAWIRLLIGEHKGYGYVDENTPELSIAVIPEYRNQGIGGRLLDILINYAKNKYEDICISVAKENRARRLYERMGFVEISENNNDIIMIKKL